MLHIRHAAGDEGRTVVAAEGQVDLATAPQLAAALAQAQRAGAREIVADLTKVDFLDSVGVRVLVEAAREAAQVNASVSVQGATGWVARVLEITGVDDYLRVIPQHPAGSGDAGR
jgi:anti-sigma B factor antagonist